MTKYIKQSTRPVTEPPPAEPLRTIQTAAAELGVHAWALRRAINAGIVPAYTPFNSRKLVRLSEVVAAINASQIGGGNA